MLATISAILMTFSLVGEKPVNMEEAGMMPEVVVSAPRYEGEDIAYSGMMPEIVVSAPRYTEEENANSGMMPEIVVVADRGTQAISEFALVRLIRRELSLRSFHRIYIVRIESRAPWFYN